MANLNRERRRILFLDYTNGIGLGGGQRSLQLLLHQLDRDRYHLSLACPPDEELLRGVPPHVDVYPLALPEEFRTLSRRSSDWRNLLASVPGMCALRRQWSTLLGRARPHVIHANNLKMHLLASFAAPAVGCPRLWHVRDILPRTAMTRALQHTGARLARRVLAVSHAVARRLPATRATEVLYNAVQLPDPTNLEQARREFRAAHDIDSGACLIGYAGRLDAGKGLDVLLNAFCRLGARHPRAELLLAGQGPMEEPLRRLAAGRIDPQRIRFAGFQSDMAPLWSALDIAVVPSTEPDSFPRSAVEAMAYHLPVVGADSGGIGEAILPGETGFLVPPGDVAELAKVLSLLAADGGLRRAQGEAGRRRCEWQFSAPVQARRLEGIYEEVLAS